MTYNELLILLQSDDIYNNIKKREEEIFELIPDLLICKGFDQNTKWHIYDVYEHILHVIENTSNKLILRLTALFHDIGKPLTYTIDSNNNGHFYNHWVESINIFTKYQDRFNLSNDDIDLIKNLIFYHDINIDKMNNDELIIMVNRIGLKNIELLFELKKADTLAQNPKYYYLLENLNKQKEKIKKYY